MNIHNKLKELENLIDEYTIDISDSTLLDFHIKLQYFELKGYWELFRELNLKRQSCKTYREKELLVDKYKGFYLSERKMYWRILRNLNDGTAKVLYPDVLKGKEEYIYSALRPSEQFDKSKSIDENLVNYMKNRLIKNIRVLNQELFMLNNYPVLYTNTVSTFIGPSSVLENRGDQISYKDAYIAASQSDGYSVFYNENTNENTNNALLNILAYFSGKPLFYFTENNNFNSKLSELYEQFELLDMLRLRKKNFFDSRHHEPFSLELPIFKRSKVCLEESQHEMIFELYHASLKQFESLPRCVFLYRVFEYGAIKHYQPLFQPSNYRPEDALDYYVQEIMNHNFIPLYYADYGMYINEDNKAIRKRKAKYNNFATKLKAEAKKIEKEWSNHSYLRGKSVGSIIYGTGRNAAAHGSGGRRTARYDYSKNYKHINDVNIFLELIARYIIEKLNPQLSNIIERRTKYYDRYNKFFEQDKNKIM
ncbi:MULTISPECIES: hypothetical protein [Bacillus cereus group]|uniref:hypothetical protein n=1 Tax=Bacillus cereus group TaxID=86661 RepID=UPI0024ADC349|nr:MULTISPECIES: hypothetical protein [Bacillus cereus group]MDI6678836.1 hypothetical protein [Bacillus wiedmannii]MDM5254955.1 hypothetical protein [Bacillus toyonensis]